MRTSSKYLGIEIGKLSKRKVTVSHGSYGYIEVSETGMWTPYQDYQLGSDTEGFHPTSVWHSHDFLIAEWPKCEY
ncbi:hypothetical protein J6590_065772 [Homalodisca vitripennis]|nr:hypothetical protein J6590_065772 [Homalodisca vitripennis]